MSGIVGVSPNMKSGVVGAAWKGAAIQTKSTEIYSVVEDDGTEVDTPSNTKLDITITPGNHVLIMSTLSFRLYGNSTASVACNFNIYHSTTDGSYSEVTTSGSALVREAYDETGNLPAYSTFEGGTSLNWMHKNVATPVNWYNIWFKMQGGTFVKIGADSNWGTTMTLMEIQA